MSPCESNNYVLVISVSNHISPLSAVTEGHENTAGLSGSKNESSFAILLPQKICRGEIWPTTARPPERDSAPQAPLQTWEWWKVSEFLWKISWPSHAHPLALIMFPFLIQCISARPHAKVYHTNSWIPKLKTKCKAREILVTSPDSKQADVGSIWFVCFNPTRTNHVLPTECLKSSEINNTCHVQPRYGALYYAVTTEEKELRGGEGEGRGGGG